MTVPSNLTSTRFSSLAPTPPAEKPAAANQSRATPQTRESAHAGAAVAAGGAGRASRQHDCLTYRGPCVDPEHSSSFHPCRCVVDARRGAAASGRLRRRRAAVPADFGHAENHPGRRSCRGLAVRHVFIRHRLNHDTQTDCLRAGGAGRRVVDGRSSATARTRSECGERRVEERFRRCTAALAGRAVRVPRHSARHHARRIPRGLERARDAARQRAGLRDGRAGGRARHAAEVARESDGGLPLGASRGQRLGGVASRRRRRAGTGACAALCACRRPERIASVRDFFRDRRDHRRRLARRARGPLWPAASGDAERVVDRARCRSMSGKTR